MEKNYSTISYRLKFIDSTRIMATSLSKLFDYRGEEFYKIISKFGYGDKKCETFGFKQNPVNSRLDEDVLRMA